MDPPDGSWVLPEGLVPGMGAKHPISSLHMYWAWGSPVHFISLPNVDLVWTLKSAGQMCVTFHEI